MAGIVTQVISSRFSTDTTATRVVSWRFPLRRQLRWHYTSPAPLLASDGSSFGNAIGPSRVIYFTFFHFYFISLLNCLPLYIVSHFPEMQLGQVGSLQLRRNALSPVSPGIWGEVLRGKKRLTFNSFHFVIFFGKFCLIVKVYQTKFANLNDSVSCTKKAYICHIVLRKRANKWPISSFWWYQLQWTVQEALAHLKTRMLILFINQHWENILNDFDWLSSCSTRLYVILD